MILGSISYNCFPIKHKVSFFLKQFSLSPSNRSNNLDPTLFFFCLGSSRLCHDLVGRVQFIIVKIKLCDKTVREITLNKCKLQYIIHSIYIIALPGKAHHNHTATANKLSCSHNTGQNFSDLFCIFAFKLIRSHVLGFTFSRHWAEHISFYLSIKTFRWIPPNASYFYNWSNVGLVCCQLDVSRLNWESLEKKTQTASESNILSWY